MSVLNQSGEEQVECPLCMEPLEVDDLNFYPCTCGYQICRFCWHRIRTDENGLCPACRKAYSENPADFTPLSKEQVAQLKAEKRQRDQQRKAKLSESRKHLASVRVVQKNLVFVVGLPVRLADADVLKRHEYFGKFGKIHKVVINQSTSYAGSQGPSASAYVTYMKSDDALRAIQSVNNITLDGRLIKSSLGTTKYCSHFMKNQPCPKVDCMYLHDFGDPEASFTKEQMHLGKHQEYEKKLHDALLSRAAAAQLQQQQQQTTTTVVTTTTTTTNGATEKVVTSSTTGSGSSSSVTTSSPPQDAKNTTAKQKDNTTTSNWPTLSTTPDTNGYTNHKSEKQKIDTKTETKSQKKSNQKNKNNNNNSSTNNNLESLKKNEKTSINKNGEQLCPTATDKSIVKDSSVDIPAATIECIDNLQKIQLVDDNSSFFSHNTFQKLIPDQDSSSYSTDSSSVTPHSNILNDNLPDISSSEDWQAAFGFGSQLRKSNGTPPAQTNPVTSETYIRPAENGFVHHKPAAAPLETINGINHHLIDGFVKQNGYDGLKSRESSILDMLAGRHFLNQQQQQQNERLGHQQMPYLNHTKSENGLNGLDQQMTKFFAEFNNKSQQQQQHKENFFNSGLINQQTNGFVPNMPPNDRQQNFISNQLNLSESQHNNLLIYQQRLMDKQLLEDQAIYNLKQNVFNNPQQQQQFLQQQLQQQQHHSGTQQFLTNGTDHYMNNQQNGQNFGNSPYTQNSVYQQNQTLIQQRNQLHLNNRSSVDDELGFDPFHETQKALAELIESEQGVSQLQTTNLLNQSSLGHNSSSSGPVNGLVHGAGVSSNAPGSHLPPPPPGFMQQQPNHMNSFGSKVLPFLNMSNSQQISSSNSSGGWTTYNNTEPHMKALPAVNDWTTLDPAIVSSSRHFPLANIQPLRNFEYNPFQQQQQQQQQQQAQQQQHQQQQNPMRNYDYSHTNGYTNNSFANNSLSQHNLQTYTNNYGSHSATTNGLNWFDNDIHGQISSPPGFRQPTPSAQSKTQEC